MTRRRRRRRYRMRQAWLARLQLRQRHFWKWAKRGDRGLLVNLVTEQLIAARRRAEQLFFELSKKLALAAAQLCYQSKAEIQIKLGASDGIGSGSVGGDDCRLLDGGVNEQAGEKE